jgi:hypothetical protein
MKKIFLYIVCLVSSGSAYAQQFPSEFWHDGKIITDTGDTLRGLVKYDMQQDLIQYNNQKGSIEALTARKVLFFEIYDVTVGQYREFYSLKYNTTSGYRTPVLFELLTDGKVTVLCRERIENQTSSTPYYYGPTYSRMVLVYSYFMLKENGDIVDFSTKRSDVQTLMGKHWDNIQGYMKDNKLRLENKDHLKKIITYYNSFFKTNK